MLNSTTATHSRQPLADILRRQSEVLQFQLARLIQCVKCGDEKLIRDELETAAEILELSRPGQDESGNCFMCGGRIAADGSCDCTPANDKEEQK